MDDIMSKAETALVRAFQIEETKYTSFLDTINKKNDYVQLYASIQILKQLEKTNALLAEVIQRLEYIDCNMSAMGQNRDHEVNSPGS